MWYERRRPLRETAPVVEKTPEQLAAEKAERAERYQQLKADWGLMNPLKKYRVDVFKEVLTVEAHYFTTDTHGNLSFYVRLYDPFADAIGRGKKELVFWTRENQVRCVELVKE